MVSNWSQAMLPLVSVSRHWSTRRPIYSPATGLPETRWACTSFCVRFICACLPSAGASNGPRSPPVGGQPAENGPRSPPVGGHPAENRPRSPPVGEFARDQVGTHELLREIHTRLFTISGGLEWPPLSPRRRTARGEWPPLSPRRRTAREAACYRFSTGLKARRPGPL